jgi:hypothetical protein
LESLSIVFVETVSTKDSEDDAIIYHLWNRPITAGGEPSRRREGLGKNLNNPYWGKKMGRKSHLSKGQEQGFNGHGSRSTVIYLWGT